MVGGTDNNQLKVAAEEMAVVATATETAKATETAMVTAMTKTPAPKMAH
jgi:hypothetical protein